MGPMHPSFPSPPEPHVVPAGEHPLWDEALAAVNRDLAATLPEQRPLCLIAYPADEREDERVYVALADGNAHGNSLQPTGSTDWALWGVAEAAQDTITGCLWQAWPVCTLHGLGMHLGEESGRPVWSCAGGGRPGDPAHVRAAVGELDTVHRPHRPNRKRRKDGKGR
ncbi:hypothetical protein ACZ91_51460 [Streptomyces regensis]|nr:hypothetical protein ACZ91_51460 [Streptomyces regensis]KOG63007.1 hypothetical protein ADK77_25490 [Streptomyces antibioticus]